MNRADLDQHLAAGTITQREHEILAYRIRGISQYTIGLGLHISRSTVKSIERNALDKIHRHRKDTAA